MLFLFLLFSSCVCNAQNMSDNVEMPITIMADSIAQDNTQTMEMSPQLEQVLHSTVYKRRAKNERLIGGLCLGVGTVSFFASKFVKFIVSESENNKQSNYKLFDAWSYASGAIAFASIPIFYDSYRNTKKSKTAVGYIPLKGSKLEISRSGWKYELSGGITTSVEDYNQERLLGWYAALETRYYFDNSNFDIAVQAAYDVTRRSDEFDGTVNEGAIRIGVLCDYNFIKHGNLNPFVGVGVGSGIPLIVFAQPRIGLRINEHHAVTLTTHIGLGDKARYSTNKYITNICLGYGYIF